MDRAKRLEELGESKVNRGLVTSSSHILNEHNPYVRDFMAVAQWNNDNDEIKDFQVVIHADKKPVGQHSDCYNAPTTNEIAAVLVDQDIVESRDIVIRIRKGKLRRIAETISLSEFFSAKSFILTQEIFTWLIWLKR